MYVSIINPESSSFVFALIEDVMSQRYIIGPLNVVDSVNRERDVLLMLRMPCGHI